MLKNRAPSADSVTAQPAYAGNERRRILARHIDLLRTAPITSIRRYASVSLFRLLLLAIVLAVSALPSIPQPRDPFAFSLTSYAVGPAFGFRERFFTETGDGNGLGFSLSDYMDGPQFLTAFERLGAEQVLGYPVSRPFVEEDGLVYQLAQRALLQWFPDESLVRLANLYQILEEAGLDDALFEQFIPKPLQAQASSYDEAKATRLGWLTHGAIRDAYLQSPARTRR